MAAAAAPTADMYERRRVGGQLNAVDRIVSWFNPTAGVRRAQARNVMAYYEAAKPSHQRKFRRDASSPDRLVKQGAEAIRAQMRHADRNHDLVHGALNVLVNNVVGPSGIGVEPQPRKLDGTIHTEYAGELREVIRKWERRPEVTWTHDWQRSQRLVARTWFRDGEAFTQRLMGPVQYLTHGSALPYSLEMLEPDMIPMGYDDANKGIRQGIQRDAWLRRQGYFVYKKHPGDLMAAQSYGDCKFIPADRMLQVADVDRIGQLRGVSRFASVIQRLEDLKDYEESERIAAKVAAMMTAYVKRIAPADEGYTGPTKDANGDPVQREIGMSPGMIIDTLAVGEEIGIIDSKRPNPNLVTWRGGQLRAFAAGINASYSSLSRDYNGTYSAQRQELVEQFVHYAAITDDFVGMYVQPVHEDIVLMAHMSGLVKRPKDVRPGSEYDFLFMAPSMPWINPMHEAAAWLDLVQAGFASEVEVIRKRGGNPDDVLAQIKQFRDKARAQRLNFTSDPGNKAGPQQPQPGV